MLKYKARRTERKFSEIKRQDDLDYSFFIAYNLICNCIRKFYSNRFLLVKKYIYIKNGKLLVKTFICRKLYTYNGKREITRRKRRMRALSTDNFIIYYIHYSLQNTMENIEYHHILGMAERKERKYIKKTFA